MNRTGKENTQFLKIQKDSAERLLRLLKTKLPNENILDKRITTMHMGHYVLFPLVKDKKKVNNLIECIGNELNFEIINAKGKIDPNHKFRSLEEALVGELPEDMIDLIPKSYDIIGTIAIIEFDQLNALNDKKISHHKRKVAKALVEVNKIVKTVYEKKSEVKGKYRLKELQPIFGG
ncbi:MAG: hypothetical protein ACTSO8_08130 [Promethearchaeota archaeon]